MRASKLLLLCLSLTCTLASGTDTEVNPVRREPATKPAEAGVQKLIVKFREEGTSGAATQSSTTSAPSTGKIRAEAASKRAGLMLADSYEIAPGMHAMKVRTLSSGD